MLLKIGKMTPRCLKQLPDDEYTGESRLTPGSPDSPVVNAPGSLNYPVMNTPGSRRLGVFGTSIRTGLQTNFMVTNKPGSQDSSMY